jgi:hypothetical protein
MMSEDEEYTNSETPKDFKNMTVSEFMKSKYTDGSGINYFNLSIL